MKKLQAIITIYIVVCTLVFGQKRELRFDLEEGKEYSFVTSMNDELVRDLAGSQKILKISTELITHFYILKKTADGYKVNLSYSYMQGDFETTESDADELRNIYRDLAGINMVINQIEATIVMDDKGIMKNTGAFEGLAEKIVAKIPDSLLVTKDKVEKLLSKIREDFKPFGFHFPNKPVSPGDQWISKDTLLDVGTEFFAETKYTFREETDSTYLITSFSKFRSIESSEDKPFFGFAEYDLTGNSKIDFEIDKSTCWVKTLEANRSIKGITHVRYIRIIPWGFDVPTRSNKSIKVVGKVTN